MTLVSTIRDFGSEGVKHNGYDVTEEYDGILYFGGNWFVCWHFWHGRLDDRWCAQKIERDTNQGGILYNSIYGNFQTSAKPVFPRQIEVWRRKTGGCHDFRRVCVSVSLARRRWAQDLIDSIPTAINLASSILEISSGSCLVEAPYCSREVKPITL